MRYGLNIRLPAALSLLAFICAALPAAGKYPERPVTLVVSVAPGAGPDVIARVLADRLTHLWKQQVRHRDTARQTPTPAPQNSTVFLDDLGLCPCVSMTHVDKPGQCRYVTRLLPRPSGGETWRS
jgi:hypothetical protein